MNVGNDVHNFPSLPTFMMMTHGRGKQLTVHKFDDLMTPLLIWFDLRLMASLNNTYGVPVWIIDVIILFQISRAGNVFTA